MTEVALRPSEPSTTAPSPVSRVSDWLQERGRAVIHRLESMHPAAVLVGLAVLLFAYVFGSLGVMNQRNFGTWSYDMGIYDQGLWLVSRGEQFMSVRGMNFWGHHFNVIAILFVPAYWFGAGPEFLYVVQAIGLALGAIPTYLIARDKLRSPWMGLLFAVVYLMYAPVQWISWAMFHPEALVITPFLFAWWFATKDKAIEAGTSYRVIPWQMGLVAKLLRLLPNAVFDKAFSARPRKPRRASP